MFETSMLSPNIYEAQSSDDKPDDGLASLISTCMAGFL